MGNRLAAATSPYLLQHAENPVDWWEWGEEAFTEARRRGVPVFLSIGYAACHWCHVMAHESFEDDATAAELNEHFVCVKVDREERPDVDAVYMNATVAMTGQGGWPMTVVLDHDGNPFFAGTYFPNTPRGGQPSLRQLLAALTEAWRDKPDDVRRVGAQLREHLQLGQVTPSGSLSPADLAAAADRLAADFDAEAAGFGGAPKFPPSMVLEFLRRRGLETVAARPEEPRDEASRRAQPPRPTSGGSSVERSRDQAREGSSVERSRDQAREGSSVERSRDQAMVDATLEAMARGGIYDQLGGGFARYSVDRSWVVPHFEKMLYDNAQLVGLYARWGTPLGDRVATETADFLLRELRTEQAGFASALDADSEGVEGKFYAWTPAQLTDVLGAEDGAWAGDLLEVTGTFEHGSSVLQLLRDPDDADRWTDVRTRLLESRSTRILPARDDKVVAAWNGLAISGLLDAGRLLGREEYVGAALAAGRLLVDVHLVDGRLRRVSRDGRVGAPAGVLEDLGAVAGGFLALCGATGDEAWLGRATGLLDDALTRFGSDDGGFFDTGDDAEALIARPRDPGDNASPSGASATVHALLAAHALTGEGRWRDAADAALASIAPLARQAPRFAGWSLAAAQAVADGAPEIAVVGPPGVERDALEQSARRWPGAVVVVAEDADPAIPLLIGRGPLDGHPAAYVCRDQVCERPVTDAALVTPSRVVREGT